MTLISLDYLDLVIAASLVAFAGGLSLIMRLGLIKRLSIATLRTVVQLSLLGVVLKWVFSVETWYVVVALLASMTINAGIAAVSRTERRFRGIWTGGLFAITVSSVVTTFVVIAVVVRVDPWYQPRYVIPLLGMVLGNSLTGISLCLDRIMADLDDKRDQVEGWLALGATGWEACRPFIRDAVRTGMIPIINSMTVVGLVSLPGMMTGQILVGGDPIDAVKYQLVVMFMIASAATLGSILAAVIVYRRLITPSHQLARHRLRRR